MTDAMILVAIKKMIVMSSFRPASQKFAEMFRKRLESQRVSRVSMKKPLFFFKFDLSLTWQKIFVQCSKATFA